MGNSGGRPRLERNLRSGTSNVPLLNKRPTSQKKYHISSAYGFASLCSRRREGKLLGLGMGAVCWEGDGENNQRDCSE